MRFPTRIDNGTGKLYAFFLHFDNNTLIVLNFPDVHTAAETEHPGFHGKSGFGKIDSIK